MKKITQAFMKILMSVGVQEDNIKGITELLYDNLEGMDKLVEYIKQNLNATESEIIKKSLEIAKDLGKIK